MIYMAQILSRIWPDIFSHDLFFAYGSQEQFSIFAGPVAKLYQAWGMPVTQPVLLLVCHTAFMAVLWLTLQDLPSASLRWGGLASVAALSHLYGAQGLLGFAETFITARTLAEPVALAALLLLLRERKAPAAALLVLTASIHPLIGLSVAVVCWICLCQSDRRWLWAAPGFALLALILALTGRAPFTGLLERFDAQWWSPVATFNAIVVLSNWFASDWQVVALDAFLLMLSDRSLPPRLALLARGLLIAGAALLCLSAIGADLLHNVLLTSLQFWRVLWLIHLFALAFLPIIAWQRWSGSRHQRLAALALVAAVLAVNARWDTGWAFIAWAVGAEYLAYRPRLLGKRLEVAARAATALSIIGLTVAVAFKTITTLHTLDIPIDNRSLSLTALSLPLVSLSIAALLLRAQAGSVLARATCIAALACLVGYGAAKWDRRVNWTRFLEESIFREHPFNQFIPEQAQVYWHDEPEASWMLLKRANFVSGPQGSGMLFNRGTAMEFIRRQPVMAVLDMQRMVCSVMQGLDPRKQTSDCAPRRELLAEICRQEHGPDFLVLRHDVERSSIAQWTFDRSNQPRTYYLYDCLTLR